MLYQTLKGFTPADTSSITKLFWPKQTFKGDKKKKKKLWLKGDMTACQASDRAAAVKSTSRIWCPRFKATGRITVCSLDN